MASGPNYLLRRPARSGLFADTGVLGSGGGRDAVAVGRVLLRLAEVYPHDLAHDWRRIYDDYDNLQSGKLSGWKLHDAGVFIQLTTAYDLTCNSDVYSDTDKEIGRAHV